jgi:two-component system, chemotaxis family, chemotaxis protein CheY
MARPTSALIADDEQHVRVYLRMLLTQLGVSEIWEAADGRSALESFSTNKPEVVLLDHFLQGRNGVSVMQDMRALDSAVPMIVISSQVAMRSVQEMNSLGAAAYILKQSPREQMLKMLAEALDSVFSDV